MYILITHVYTYRNTHVHSYLPCLIPDQVEKYQEIALSEARDGGVAETRLTFTL